MKRLYILTLAALFAGMVCYAQNEYYYYKGSKQWLTLDRTKLNVTVAANDAQEALVTGVDFGDIVFQDDNTTPGLKLGSMVFSDEASETTYQQTIDMLLNNDNVIAVHPNYVTAENKEIGMSSYFYVKLNELSDNDMLSQLAAQTGVIIVEQNEFMPLWYTL